MSNVKQVKIVANLNVMGVMDAAGRREEDDLYAKAEMVRYQNVSEDNAADAFPAAKVVRDFMAQTVVPYFGLNIKFTGNEIIETNQVGGQVRYLQCIITGHEAVSWEYLKALVYALKQWSHGGVEENVDDIEA